MQRAADLAKPALLVQTAGLGDGGCRGYHGDEGVELEAGMVVAVDLGEEGLYEALAGHLAGLEEFLVFVGWQLGGNQGGRHGNVVGALVMDGDALHCTHAYMRRADTNYIVATLCCCLACLPACQVRWVSYCQLTPFLSVQVVAQILKSPLEQDQIPAVRA